jgi:prepilin-type N-terminal cleavage/methylation domain-containing protein
LSPERGPRAAQGFTLAELAVVMMIVALLLGSMLYTLSVQLEQRAIEETRSRLEAARQLLLSFAIVNGRLPCPATAATLGGEAFTGANCTAPYGGFLPAMTIGYQVVDANGFAIDAWNNRIRYAVSAATPLNSQTPRVCRSVDPATPPVVPHFTNQSNLRQNGVDCQPTDLVVCKSSTGITATTCGPAANVLTNQNVVVAIVYSIGKNGSLPCGTCVDEAANTNGDQVFVSHTLAPAGAPGGEFDDQMVWITVGELYGRMISAGVLP